MAEYGPLRILDLRTTREIDREGMPEALIGLGAEFWHRPLSDPSFLLDVVRPTWQDYFSSYVRLMPSADNVIVDLAAAYAAQTAKTTIVCCTAGKDRTGVVVAMLLRLVGVSTSDIARDYALSARQLRAHLGSFKAHWEKRGLSPQQYAIRLETQARTMTALLAHPETQWHIDSVERELGGETIRRLRATMIDHRHQGEASRGRTV